MKKDDNTKEASWLALLLLLVPVIFFTLYNNYTQDNNKELGLILPVELMLAAVRDGDIVKASTYFSGKIHFKQGDQADVFEKEREVTPKSITVNTEGFGAVFRRLSEYGSAIGHDDTVYAPFWEYEKLRRNMGILHGSLIHKKSGEKKQTRIVLRKEKGLWRITYVEII